MTRHDDRWSRIEGFDWDDGNFFKNLTKHGVSGLECEETFFNEPLLIHDDAPHSHTEDRYYLLGKTDGNRLLFLVFTLRAKKIRVISARDMSRKERKVYETLEKNP